MQHSHAPFYSKGQGIDFARAIFLWWFPFFCAEKNQKNRGSVQKLCRNFGLDTWVNEKTAGGGLRC